MVDLNKILSYFFKRHGWSRNSVNDFKQALRELDVTVIEVTYKELLNLANTSNLEPYRRYKITDFQTIHYIPKTDSEVNYGPVEPIIVQAANESELFAEAYSPEFPGDVLYYTLDLTGISSGYLPNDHKGWIYHRNDTIRDVKVDEDFRAVRYRRWRVGSNALGLAENLYCLHDTEVLVGWDETVPVQSIAYGEDNVEGRNKLTAPDPEDYQDLLMFNNRRELNRPDNQEDNFDYKHIDIVAGTNNDMDFGGSRVLTNFVYINTGTGDGSERFRYVTISAGGFNTANQDNTILSDSIHQLEVKRNFNYNIIVGKLFGYFHDFIGNVVDGSLPANDLNYKYPSFQYCSLLSKLNYDSRFWPTTAENIGNEFDGQIIKCVFKATDNNGNVIDSGKTPFTGCYFRDIKGLNFTKLDGSSFNYCEFINVVNGVRSSRGSATAEINYTFDQNTQLERRFFDRYLQKSNIPLTLSDTNLELSSGEQKIIGEVVFNLGGSELSLYQIPGTYPDDNPEHTLRLIAPQGLLLIESGTGDPGTIVLPKDNTGAEISIPALSGNDEVYLSANDTGQLLIFGHNKY